MRNREQGFSLLEVLAAVSLLIILFIPLVRAAIDGLRSEGESRRRMEASLLADNALAEIESDLVIGVVPPVGEEQWEDGEFLGITSVTSFDLALFDPEQGNGQPAERGPAAAPSLGGDPGLVESIFPAAGSHEPSPLRMIEIVVSWSGQGDPEPGDAEAEQRNRVVRTTFGFDLISVRDKLGPVDSATLEEQADALDALLP